MKIQITLLCSILAMQNCMASERDRSAVLHEGDRSKCKITKSAFLFLKDLEAQQKQNDTFVKAASNNNIEGVMSLLLRQGATRSLNINERDEEGKTALHYAASFHNNSMISLLCYAEVNRSVRDRQNKIPQEYYTGFTKEVRDLLDPNIPLPKPILAQS